MDDNALRPIMPSNELGHERSSSFASIKSTTSSFGPLSPALSDTSTSSHLSRRSSLSHNRNRSSLNATGKTAAPAFMYLPPGAACHDMQDDGVDPSHPVSLARLDPTGGVCVATTAPNGTDRAAHSRRLSSSSSITSSGGKSKDVMSSPTLLSNVELATSPPSSFREDTNPPILPPPPQISPMIPTAMSIKEAGRKPSVAKERAPGEDPELAAARRALWEDEPVHNEADGTRPSVFAEDDDDEASQRTPKATTTVFDFDRGPIHSPPLSDYEEQRVEYAAEPPSLVGTDEYGDEDDDDERPPPATPGHATLPPLPSCLRPMAPLSRRHSATSSSAETGTTISVRISEEPPASFPTHSPIDYERKGDEPVSRLSVREWLELQGVREAVGVWSGRIQKPDEVQIAALEAQKTNAPQAAVTTNSIADKGNTVSLSDSVSSLRSNQSSAASTGSADGLEDTGGPVSRSSSAELRSRGGLAAIVGVVTVGHNSVPVTAPKSLFD
ncbi:hypothetical protein OIO90_005071 [Microbotryomycetes sp. JL221]|nr:hypothetical protein OIO90_005071 [Microbotryomycetes sp. JL221]